MNYYPFHIGDYASATRHLSWDEDAAYRRLLDVYYTQEKPLPNDMRAVCRLVLASTEVQREAVRVVLEEFFECTEEGWINKRADDEIDAMREKQQKQRDKANKRWHKPEQEPGNTPAMPQHQSDDAAASKNIADAVPPTPTPTPTPTPKIEDIPSSSPTLPSCPHDDLIGLYRQHLPNLPQPRKELWTGPRARNLQSRWRWVLTATRDDGTRYAETTDQAIGWFSRFFEAVAESDFLTGRDGKWQGCDLAWLVKAENFAKVVQGNYANREGK